MTTHEQRRGRRAPAPTVRVSLDELLRSKVSMLGDAMAPKGYGDIETVSDVVEEAFDKQDERIVRLHIVWDAPVGNLPIEEALDLMRGTGAAMVTKVEAVK